LATTDDRLTEIILELTRDPLSETTRKERKALLGISTLAITVGHARIIPERISALGVDLSITDQQALIYILQAILCYFLFAFFYYVSTDWLKWHYLRTALQKEGELKPSEMGFREGRIRDELMRIANFSIVRGSRLRILFDFLVPILIGVYAIFALIPLR
jgi:hypothetical protein